MKKIFNNLRIFKTTDEICGTWTTEDGSGFSMIMGAWINFKSNGSGEYERWTNGDNETSYHLKGNFSWKRIDKDKIEIDELKNSKKELISYKIKKVNNRLELSNQENKIVGSTEIEEFWDFAQVMFKRK